MWYNVSVNAVEQSSVFHVYHDYCKTNNSLVSSAFIDNNLAILLHSSIKLAVRGLLAVRSVHSNCAVVRFLKNQTCNIHKTNCTQKLNRLVYYSEVYTVHYGQWEDHISSCSWYHCTTVTLVEFTVAENHWCKDRPDVDNDASPAGCNLYPHRRLIHRQVQVWLRPTCNTNTTHKHCCR